MQLTKAVKNLLIINLIVFFATSLLNLYFIKDFILYPVTSGEFQPLQLLTYMFLHSSVMHIVFNMIGLVVFGPEIEHRLGTIKFTKVYLISGVICGLAHIMFINNPVVGASGAIWCLMMLYALFNPEQIFNIYFIIPAKIKYIVGVYFFIEVILAIHSNDGVSHIAHVTGGLCGAVTYLLDKRSFKSSKP